MGNRVPVADERVQKVVDHLQLEKVHLRKLFKAFSKYDKDRSGTIDLEEFYMMVGEKPSVFGDSIFSLIDVDGSGGLEFSEFVEATATFCMMGKEDMLKFCFYIFDKDKNGYIEEDELQDLISILHTAGTTANVESSLLAMASERANKITFKQFTAMNEDYPQVLYPAFRMQHSLQEITLGSSYWSSRKAMFRKERMQEAEEKIAKKKARKAAIEQQQNLIAKKRMGAFKYYCCLAEREKYIASITEEEMEFARKEIEKKHGSPKSGKKEVKSPKSSKKSPKSKGKSKSKSGGDKNGKKKEKDKKKKDKKKDKKKKDKKKKKRKSSQWD
eukprot:g4461.t1